MLFEEGISLTLLPDSENNINTLIEIIYHQGNSFDIILQICIDRNIYELERAGGEASLRALNVDWGYSKQTMSSALKTMESRGLIELSFEEGSRKSKRASLTGMGRAFVDKNIVPAMRAEERAFFSLDQEERETLMALARRYAEALTREFENMNGSRSEDGRRENGAKGAANATDAAEGQGAA